MSSDLFIFFRKTFKMAHKKSLFKKPHKVKSLDGGHCTTHQTATKIGKYRWQQVSVPLEIVQSSKYLPCRSIFSSSAYLHIILVDYILGKKVSIENRAATKKKYQHKKMNNTISFTVQLCAKKGIGHAIYYYCFTLGSIEIKYCQYYIKIHTH